MAVLTKKKIVRLLKKGSIKITPLNQKAIGPASVDLHLGNKFRVFKPNQKAYHLNKDIDYHHVTNLITVNDHYTLKPGETIHGITQETITLPSNICAWIQGKSSLGRLGLTVHITASFIQPGISNKQVLEMNNAGPVPLVLYPGIPICQIIFETTKGKAKYSGRFSSQSQP